MKNGLREIVGKRISGVVHAVSDREPRIQVFLLFTDGSRFEFYGPNFSCCSGVDRGDRVLPYIEGGGGKVRQAYGTMPPQRPVP